MGNLKPSTLYHYLHADGVLKTPKQALLRDNAGRTQVSQGTALTSRSWSERADKLNSKGSVPQMIVEEPSDLIKHLASLRRHGVEQVLRVREPLEEL